MLCVCRPVRGGLCAPGSPIMLCFFFPLYSLHQVEPVVSAQSKIEKCRFAEITYCPAKQSVPYMKICRKQLSASGRPLGCDCDAVKNFCVFLCWRRHREPIMDAGRILSARAGKKPLSRWPRPSVLSWGVTELGHGEDSPRCPAA